MKYQKIMARSLPIEVTNGTLEGDIAPGPITFYRLQSTSDNILRAYIAQVLVPGDFDHSVTGEKSQKVTRENDQKSHLTPLIIQFPEDCQKQFLPFL